MQWISGQMSKMRRCIGAGVLALTPTLAAAEPIELKLAYFTSDHFQSYRAGVKPFVER